MYLEEHKNTLKAFKLQYPKPTYVFEYFKIFEYIRYNDSESMNRIKINKNAIILLFI